MTDKAIELCTKYAVPVAKKFVEVAITYGPPVALAVLTRKTELKAQAEFNAYKLKVDELNLKVNGNK